MKDSVLKTKNENGLHVFTINLDANQDGNLDSNETDPRPIKYYYLIFNDIPSVGLKLVHGFL